MKWRFIPFQKYDPYTRIALNEIILQETIESQIPVVSLSGWSKDCISLGYSQKIDNVLNLDTVKENNIIITRRHSSGGAIYLSSNNEICWGILAPDTYFNGDLQNIYTKATSLIISALKELGITAYHKPINDIVTDKGKISGSAMKKSKNIVYVHGTLLYSVDKELINNILKPENDHQKASLIEKKKLLTSIKQESSSTSYEQVVEILQKHMLRNKQYDVYTFSKDQINQAEAKSQYYKSHEWIYKF